MLVLTLIQFQRILYSKLNIGRPPKINIIVGHIEISGRDCINPLFDGLLQNMTQKDEG